MPTSETAIRPAWGYPEAASKRKAPLLGVTEAVTMEGRLGRILGDSFGFDEGEIEVGTRLDELGMDSLDFVEMAMRCEEVFEIEFREDEDFGKLRTIKDWLRVIERGVANEGNGGAGGSLG